MEARSFVPEELQALVAAVVLSAGIAGMGHRAAQVRLILKGVSYLFFKLTEFRHVNPLP